MKQSCRFNKFRDLAVHRPNLHIDVSQVLESHKLPVGGGFDTPFDNVENIEQVGPRVESAFDAIEAGRAINNYLDEFQSGTGNTTVAQPPSQPNEVSNE